MDRVIEIDERWISEWLKFGQIELESYMRRQAQFLAWCRDHDRDKP